MRWFRVGVAIVAVMVIGLVSFDRHTAAETVGDPFVGTWQWSYYGYTSIFPYAIFHSDGTFIKYDPNIGVGLGIWQATGVQTADLTVVFQDANYALNTFTPGRIVYRMSVKVDGSGNQILGSGTIDGVTDGNGGVLPPYPFNASANRLIG